MVKAKLFKNGQSQAVRLPKGFRLEGKEVSVIRLGSGIVLQPIISCWRDVFNEIGKIKSDDILENREDTPPVDKEKFI